MSSTPSWRRALPALALLLAVVAALSFALFRGSNKPALPGGAQQSAPASGLEGTLALPARQAPASELRNYLGKRVSLAGYGGKAVLSVSVDPRGDTPAAVVRTARDRT